jgi:ABC-type microcin C transport system duplicated ATPase subunit YejF
MEKFMDQKIKNYSSGMQVRLAFSIATRAETDILLIDEVLAVGDQSFQEKCFDYFSKIKKSDKTVIFVTHDMSNVERFCDRVFVLDRKTEVNGMYSISGAVKVYNKLNHDSDESVDLDSKSSSQAKKTKVYIKAVEILDAHGKPCNSFVQGDALVVKVDIDSQKAPTELPIAIGLAFHTHDNINLSGPNTTKLGFTTKSKSITYKIHALPLNMGEYYLTIGLFDGKAAIQYDFMDKEVKFFVNTNEVQYGLLNMDAEWEAK